MANNRGSSADAHCDDGAGSVSLSLLPKMVANTVMMYSNDQIPSKLHDIQNPYSMTLCWCLLSEWGRECVTLAFADTASQYLIYDCLQPITTQITHDAQPKIVQAALMLILPGAYPQYAIIQFGIV